MPESSLRAALLDAAALLLPVTCAGCGADDRELCDECAAALAPVPRRRVLADGTAVHAGLDYAGVVRDVVVAMKTDRPGLARRLAPPLAAAIAAAVADAPIGRSDDGAIELCAVPSTRRARRRRGYEPVGRMLAAGGFRAVAAFRPARPHPAQKTLGLAERSAHLSDVFRPRGPLNGRRFIVVDDVVTTGATLAAAASALRSAGAEVLACAVVASTPRRVGGFGGDPAGTLRKPPGAAS